MEKIKITSDQLLFRNGALSGFRIGDRHPARSWEKDRCAKVMISKLLCWLNLKCVPELNFILYTFFRAVEHVRRFGVRLVLDKEIPQNPWLNLLKRKKSIIAQHKAT